MATVQLQPRPLYGIGTVSRLTGIKADTLRVWERRYDLISALRSYSDDLATYSCKIDLNHFVNSRQDYSKY
jgi:hypothetical protein